MLGQPSVSVGTKTLGEVTVPITGIGTAGTGFIHAASDARSPSRLSGGLECVVALDLVCGRPQVSGLPAAE